MSKQKPVSPTSKIVFLDRDGTLNDDPGYIHHPDELHLLPGVGEALKIFKEAGFEPVVVTNQSGVARGLIEPEQLPRIHARLNEHLMPFGVQIRHFEVCTHHPDDRCGCRKPSPKLLTDAAQRLGVRLEDCWMIGDRATDLQAGRSAGVGRVILVRTGDGKKTEANLSAGLADAIVDSLLDAAQRCSVPFG